MSGNLEERLNRLESKVDKLIEKVGEIRGTSTTQTLIRFVIFPLITVVGGIYGISVFGG